MFRLLTLFIFPYLLAACQPGGSGTGNDLDEYGFQGKVPRVITYVYEHPEKAEDRREPVDKVDYVGRTVLVFNETGGLDSLSSRYRIAAGSEEWIGSDIVFHYEGGKKSGTTRYDLSGNKAATATITWVDDRHYKLVDLEGTRRLESESWLTEEFRDWKGETRLYHSDTLVWEESYENKLDDRLRILETRVKRPLDGEDFVTRPKGVETDDQGNVNRHVINMTNQPGNERLFIRTFEYYE